MTRSQQRAGTSSTDPIRSLIAGAFGVAGLIASPAVGQIQFDQPDIVQGPTGGRNFATGDFNSDALPDIATFRIDSSRHAFLQIYLNQPDGSFVNSASIPAEYSRGDFASGDVDGDGHIDIVWWNYDTAYIFFNDGDGSSGSIAMIGTSYVSIGTFLSLSDLDENGTLDIVKSVYGTNAIELIAIYMIGRNPQKTESIFVLPFERQDPFLERLTQWHADCCVSAASICSRCSTPTQQVQGGTAINHGQTTSE